MSGWTDERVEQLKEFYAEGLSMSQIARQLGHATRNSVLSKVHRLGLVRRGKQVASTPASLRLSQPKKPREPAALVSPPPLERAPPLPFRPAPPHAPASGGRGVPLLQLGACQCRWPVRELPIISSEEQEFCGKGFPDDGRRVPYCDTHLVESVQSTAPRPIKLYDPELVRRCAGRRVERASFAERAA